MAEASSYFQRFIEMEQRHAVESITLNGIPIWTYLRVYVYNRFAQGHGALTPSAGKAALVRSLFWGWGNLFRSHRYWVVSSSDQRKWMSGAWTDRHDMAPVLQGQALFIELPNPTHRSPIASEHKLSKTWFYAVELLLSKSPFLKLEVAGEQELNALLNELGVSFDLRGYAKRFWAQYRFTHFMARWKKPKAVFLTTYYTNSARIAALKDLRIPVVESQHGLVSSAHLAYQLPKASPRLLPDIYLSYGTQEEEDMKGSGFAQHVCIVPTGHFYLSHVQAHPSHDTVYTKPSKVRHRIVITAQDIFDEPFIQWLNRLVTLLPDDELVLVPRRRSIAWYRERGLSDQVKYLEGDTYRLMLSGDVHSTVFSSCAVEALGLNRPNILINLDGQATQYLDYLEHPVSATWIADTPEAFADLVNNGEFQHADSEADGRFFRQGYAKNLVSFLKQQGI